MKLDKLVKQRLDNGEEINMKAILSEIIDEIADEAIRAKMHAINNGDQEAINKLIQPKTRKLVVFSKDDPNAEYKEAPNEYIVLVHMGNLPQTSPMTTDELADFFAYLHEALEEYPCDHTLKHAEEWIAGNGLDAEVIIPWLNSEGAFCDCEVLMNVVRKVEEFIDWKFDCVA